jgi:hypothetical protein
MKIADALSGRISHNDGHLGHEAGYWLLKRLRARGTAQVCVISPEEQWFVAEVRQRKVGPAKVPL